MNNLSEYIYGLIWALITVAIMVYGLGLDFIPEQPDYFIGVVR